MALANLIGPLLLDVVRRLLRHWDVLLVAGVGAGLSFWAKLRASMTRAAARGWPVVPATIDVVSVVERGEEGKKTYVFVATLTFFYRNPELQAGEYERVFPLESAARMWVEQFKGKQILVHVNPRRPEQSVLLDDDLEAITEQRAPDEEEAIRSERIPELKRGYLVLSGISELMSIVGFAGSLVLLSMNLAAGNRHTPVWLLVAGVAMLAMVFISHWLVTISVQGEGSGSFLHFYTMWCPAWMRWGTKASGAVIGAVWLIFIFRADLPAAAQPWVHRIDPAIPYAWGCWGFLSMAAFHAAVLHSQELVRRHPETTLL